MNNTALQRSELGRKGEELARSYLQERGFVILHGNWRYAHKEIDIIALKNNTLHIVEVKTRTSDYIQRPQDAVNKTKQRFLIAAAQAYITRYSFSGEVQFDIISILIQSHSHSIDYIPQAFYPLVGK
ncbi:MAG: YraN family protein [Bacteroidales bacterium]|jgi:putative endonuclease|nr:YraN family protein [Bacteroidales bacterium]